MILDVVGDEDEDEGTRKRMLLRAIGLARLGNALRAPESKDRSFLPRSTSTKISLRLSTSSINQVSMESM
ncbi:hypothetical protein FRC18_010019 [Serendipita sp. 400]|nr:hypothetical protein FRC18_010019 [Serendipita sp. 400]